jgi:glycogen synthase
MRIGLISYEYEGHAASGGIGTYVRNAAVLLAGRGHEVEVFTSASHPGKPASDAPCPIHSVHATRATFPEEIAKLFAQRHRQRPFDVIEGPEYGADAAHISAQFPGLPLVVKLHTPGCVIGEINNLYIGWQTKLRFIGGGLRRRRLLRPFWWPEKSPDHTERDHTHCADVVAGPSQAILELLKTKWAIPREQTVFVPNVFVPPAALTIADPNTHTRRVTFLGRLEVRKGVLELADAIPMVCSKVPDARFCFIGRSLPMPGSQRDVKSVLLRKIGRWRERVEFIEAVSYREVPKLLADTDICIFPSVWENFPNVCLEAMSAARGVIGSSAGGMAEMISHGETGLLIPPRDPKAIADAVIALLRDPARRIVMGQAARAHATTAYRPEVIAPLQEASYRRAIELATRRRAEAA